MSNGQVESPLTRSLSPHDGTPTGTISLTDYNLFLSGTAGTPGSVWYNGSGVPSNGVGVNGDYYFRTSNGDIWFKAGGVWT